MIRALFLLVVLFGCTFQVPDNEPLTVSTISFQDTASVWPSFEFLLSRSIVDSFVELKLNPDPGGGYYSVLSKDRKTITFGCSEALNGSTKYLLSLSSAITSENGKILEPDNFQYVFSTFPSEKYPNNSKSQADTIFNVLFGEISPLSDTDYYIITNPVQNNLFFNNIRANSEFLLVDSTGAEIYGYSGLDSVVSISISENYEYPLFCRITALLDNGSRYSISLGEN